MRQRRGGLFAGYAVCAFLVCFGCSSIILLAQESPSFTGVFDVAVAANPSAVWELDLSASLTAVFERGQWRTASQSLFDDSGWIRQWFQSTLATGSVMGSVEIMFLPSQAELDYAWLGLQMYMFGVVLDGGLAVEPGGVGGWVGLKGQDVTGMTVGLELLFGVDQYHGLIQTGCEVAFTGARVSAELSPIPRCPDFHVRSELTLSETGFESLEIDATLPEFPTLPWLGLWPSLTFTLDEKSLDLRAGISPGDFDACFNLYFLLSFGAGVMEITTIDVRGIRMDCELAGVEFSGETWLDGGSSARMFLRGIETRLPGGYFETYRIQSLQDACCGPLEFEFAAYFLEGGAQLFDLAAMQAQFLLQVAPLLKIGSAIEFDFEQAAGNQWVYWDIFAQVSF